MKRRSPSIAFIRGHQWCIPVTSRFYGISPAARPCMDSMGFNQTVTAARRRTFTEPAGEVLTNKCKHHLRTVPQVSCANFQLEKDFPHLRRLSKACHQNMIMPQVTPAGQTLNRNYAYLGTSIALRSIEWIRLASHFATLWMHVRSGTLQQIYP